MRRPTLNVDVDEVLGDFQTPALNVIYEVTGRRYVPEDFLTWDIFSVLSREEKEDVFAIIERPGWCAAIRPLPGAREAIDEMRTFCYVRPVTSPFHSPTWQYERSIWLSDHYGFERRTVIQTSSKESVNGDALLDDNPNHIESWSREYPGGLAMLWHIPNTRGMHDFDDRRVRSWSEVVTKVRGLLGRKSVHDLLKEREFTFTHDGDSTTIMCEECRSMTRLYLHDSPKTPKHKPGCRLEEVLRGTPSI